MLKPTWIVRPDRLTRTLQRLRPAANMAVGSVVLGCGEKPTEPPTLPPPRPTLTGTFVLELLDGQPLPQPAHFLLGLSDQLLLADTLTLISAPEFRHVGSFASGVRMGVVGPFSQAATC